MIFSIIEIGKSSFYDLSEILLSTWINEMKQKFIIIATIRRRTKK